MCILANMEKAARQGTPPRKKLTTTATLKPAVTVLEAKGLVITVEGTANVLEVVENAMVLGGTKGLLLRLRKELGRALTRFASSSTNKQTHQHCNPTALPRVHRAAPPPHLQFKRANLN
jgi:hypothetical protein